MSISAQGIILPVVQLVLQLLLTPLQLVFHVLSVIERAFFQKPLPDPKVVCITGANSGIGEGLALHYAKEGVKLALIARNKERLDAVAEKCTNKGAEVTCGYIDVTDEAAMGRFLLEYDSNSPIDMLIANAGVSASTVGHQDDIVKATRALFAINIDGLFNTILPLLEPMKQRKSGQIVLMASLGSFFAVPVTTPYNATKAAVRMYSHGLRGVLARDNVHVNVICPGYVRSPLTSTVNKNFKKHFIITMPECVQYIATGLRNNDAEIVFPSSLFLMVWIGGNFLSSAAEFVGKHRLFPPTAWFRAREDKGDEKKKSK